MSLFKTIFLSLFIIFIAACGFRPMYSSSGFTSSNGALQKAGIEIANIPNEKGQYLRNALIDRLYTNGRPNNARYRLEFSTLNENVTNIGIRKDASATRAEIEITTEMHIVETMSGKILLKRKFKAIGSYNLLDNYFATMISKRDITDNLLEEIANDILTELNIYFYKNSSKQSIL